MCYFVLCRHTRVKTIFSGNDSHNDGFTLICYIPNVLFGMLHTQCVVWHVTYSMCCLACYILNVLLYIFAGGAFFDFIWNYVDPFVGPN